MLRHNLVAWAILSALLLAGSSANSAPLDDSTLRGADQDKGNWLMYGRTYDDHRFSPLDQINEQTVEKPKLA
jgi:quinohemoprotein ethanol dehydrogenase